MAPQPTYEPPHVQLRRLAVAARRRGQSFEAFWIQAVRPGMSLVMTTHPNPPVGAVRWPTDQFDRTTWRAAIEDSKDGWRRAFERIAPPAKEAALGILAPALDAVAAAAKQSAASELGSGIPAQPGVASAA